MSTNYSSEMSIQPMYRDHLFIAIFGKDDERSKRWRLELYNALNDSAYSDPDELELNTLECLNISLQKKCKPLYDYISFVSRINHKKEEEKMTAETAVREAVDWAIRQNLLEGYIKEQKEEIIGMLLEEYDEQACIRTWQEDGFIKGHKEGHKEGVQEKAVEDAKNLLKKNIPIETIVECIGLSVEQVLELQKQIEITC